MKQPHLQSSLHLPTNIGAWLRTKQQHRTVEASNIEALEILRPHSSQVISIDKLETEPIPPIESSSASQGLLAHLYLRKPRCPAGLIENGGGCTVLMPL